MSVRISVIVPIYNAEKYLVQCIESILKQTYKNFELILVNDGSKDNSKLICEEFARKDNRIKIIDKENGGSSSAKNRGLDIALGDFIEFVDADDMIDSTYFEKLHCGTLEKDVDLCIGNVSFSKIKNGNLVSRRIIDLEPGKFSLNEFLKFYPQYMPNAIIGASWNKLYKREIIENKKLRFDTNIRNNEDTRFNYLYLAECKNIYVSCEPYYNYIEHGDNSVSRGYIPNLFETYLSTYEKAIEFLKSVDMYEYNEEFTKRYFIGLVIGSIYNIVLRDKSSNKKEKINKIRVICENNHVINALKVKNNDFKKKILVYLFKTKNANLIYYLIKIYNALKNIQIR